ncbi:hypothetical protein [Blastomonas sp. CCH1-A6]|jgi:hypothetical protein|uniref:hypothetical protein n=1 Tax=Blastomonas sp. CCH1-A6 TaxID=1768762 RepID=UPI00082A7FDE
MTIYTTTLEDEEKRRRMLKPGERVTFDMAFLDSGTPSGVAVVTEAQRIADRSRMLAAARYEQAVYDANKTALNSWRGGNHAAQHETRARDAKCARETLDALRMARYS